MHRYVYSQMSAFDFFGTEFWQNGKNKICFMCPTIRQAGCSIQRRAALNDNTDFISELRARLHYDRMAEPVPTLLLQGIEKVKKEGVATEPVGALYRGR